MAPTLAEQIEGDTQSLEILQRADVGHQQAAHMLTRFDITTTEASVRRWRAKNGVVFQPPLTGLSTQAPVIDEEPDEQEAVKGSIDVSRDGAVVNNVVVDAPIANRDWSNIFALFNLDASVFEVVDDTVRMSTWQQSKRTEDGHRDTIQMYSYKARFRRISDDAIPEAVTSAWRADLINEGSPLQFRPEPSDPPVHLPGTYVIDIADPQFGKKRTAEAVENYKRGVQGHLLAARALGSAVEGVHLAFQGDETENVVNNYTNQPHTVELNLSQQLELDFDMRVWALREAILLGVPVSASSVISNHGEWTRNDGKDPVTTQNDNSSTYIARQVKRLFDDLEPFTGNHVEWHIGDGAPGVVVDLSGVPNYFSHTYVEKGKGGSVEIKTKDAIQKQILADIPRLAPVKIFHTAHYHHHWANEFEGRTVFGNPAIEAKRSSEYMSEQFGVWSEPGVMGMLVGRHLERGWTNLNIF